MRIRWKLLLLLALLSMGPLLLMAIWGGTRTAGLGREFAEMSRAELTARAEREMLARVQDYARLVGRASRTLELLCRTQARAVEEALAKAPATPASDLVWAEDLADAARPGMTSPPGYQRLAMKQRIWIDDSITSFSTPPDVERTGRIVDQARRLAGLTPDYAFVRSGDPQMIIWQFTALASGLHQVFPARGSTPTPFDERADVCWSIVRDQVLSGSPLRPEWSAPAPDPATGRILFKLCMPVREPGGGFAGMTCLAVLMSDVLAMLDTPEAWNAEAERLIVETIRRPGESPRLEVAAISDYEAQAGGDAASIRLESLADLTTDEARARRLADAIQRREVGAIVMPYRGEPAIWAHAPLAPDRLQTDTAAVVIVPQRAVTGAAIEAEQMTLARTRSHVAIAVAGVGSVLALVFLVAFVASRNVTRPISRLTDAAARLARGDFSARADVRTSDEIETLARTFNDMAPRLRDHVRLQESIELARQVQMALLPSARPEIDGIDIAGESLYCDETGGDYFDYIHPVWMGRRGLAVAMGDVTGHGIAAALLMATARAILHARAAETEDLTDIVGALNRRLCEDAIEGRFMTFAYLTLDAGGGEVRWVSAGHDPAIVYDPGQDAFSELAGADIPLGIEPDWTFAERRKRAFGAGSVLLVGTDGIWEARNPGGEQFGKGRLRSLVRAEAHRPAVEIIESVKGAVADFRGARAQEDDITLVVARNTHVFSDEPPL